MRLKDRFGIGLLAAIISVTSHATGELPPPGANVGQLTFQNLYYEPVSLATIPEAPAIVLFFFSNTCPVAKRYMPRIIELHERYQRRGLQFIAVNASPADTVQDVAQFALDYGLPFPVVKDRDFSAVRATGVTRTPEVVILDRNRVLRYRGRIDDQYRLGGARPAAATHDLANAIEDLLAGRSVAVALTRAEGCAVTFPMLPVPGEPISFTEQVRPILVERCLNCHAPAGPAPFALGTPDDLNERRDRIVEVLQDEQMPPWHAAGENPFVRECRLPPRDSHQIANWLLGSQREGESTAESRTPNVAGTPAAGARWTFTAPAAAATGLQAQRVDALLEPPLSSAISASGIAITGEHPEGFLFAETYYLRDGETTPYPLTGPVLPGQPLYFERDEGILIPAGARLGMIASYGPANARDGAAPTLTLESSGVPLHRTITCRVVEMGRAVNAQATGEVRFPSRPESRIRAVAAAVTSRGSAIALLAHTGEGDPKTLLSLPAPDPRWPLTYFFAGEEEVPENIVDLSASLQRPLSHGWPGQTDAQVSLPTARLWVYEALPPEHQP